MMIGCSDLALPRVNNWGFWILPFAFTMMLSTLFMEGGGPAGGWTMYPPLMLQTGNAFPFLIFSIHLLGISSITGAINIVRSEEHTSELQSLMRISYAVFCLKKKKTTPTISQHYHKHK